MHFQKSNARFITLILVTLMIAATCITGITPKAAAAPPVFQTPINGQTFHLIENSTSNVIEVEIQGGGEILSTDSGLILPYFANLTFDDPLDKSVAELSLINTPDGVYGITLNATNSDGQTSINIVVVIDDSRPPIEVSLDAAEYLSSETATIMVNDLAADLKVANSDEITVFVMSDNDTSNGVTLNLTESADSPHGLFTGFVEFVAVNGTNPDIPDILVGNDSKITVMYESADLISKSKQALIVDKRIEFDRSKYTLSNKPELQVMDVGANMDSNDIDEVSVVLTSPNQTKTVNLLETGVNTGIFVCKIEFTMSIISGSSCKLFMPSTGPVTANYTNHVTKAQVMDVTIEFDKEKYAPHTPGTLRLIDPNLNKNSTGIEYVTIIVKSTSYPTGIKHQLVETGPDTAEFNSTTYIRFAQDATNQNASALFAPIGDKVVAFHPDATPGNICIDICKNEVSASAEVVAGGAGSEDLGTPTPATPFGSFSAYTCSAYGGDAESDGICDNWEYPNKLELTIPYGGSTFTYARPAYDTTYASKDYKDLYVEIDWLNTNNPDPTKANFKPIQAGLDRVVTAFANAPFTYPPSSKSGIRLHYVLNEEIVRSGQLMDVWSTGTQSYSFDGLKQTNFGTISERNSGINVLYGKMQVFHWCLFADKQSFDQTSSGTAELIGNDCVVSLGHTDFLNNQEYQENTFMHELGHNLGLHHGGGLKSPYFDASGNPVWIEGYKVNCKPDYPSIMTYIRQLPNADLPDPPLDYSRYKLYPAEVYDPSNPGTPRAGTSSDPLDRTHLYDSGLRGAPSGGVTVLWGTGGTDLVRSKTITSTNYSIDWDNDGTTDSNTVVSITNTGIPGEGCNELPSTNNLYGFKDWTKETIILDHRQHNSLTFASGANSDPALLNELTSATAKAMRETGAQTLGDIVEGLPVDDFTIAASKETLLDLLTSFKSYVTNNDPLNAIDKLLEIKTLLIGAVDGDPFDERLMTNNESQGKVLEQIDTNITFLKNNMDFDSNAKSVNVIDDVWGNEIKIKSDKVSKVQNNFVIDYGKSVMVSLEGSGLVELTIPGSVIDATKLANGTMQVITDKGPAHFHASKTAEGMTVQFVFPDGAKNVTIMDTRVVPEFPLTALLLSILVLAIIVATALFSRTKGIASSFYKG